MQVALSATFALAASALAVAAHHQSTTGAISLRMAGPATLDSTSGACARLAVRIFPQLGLPDPNCRCAGTTAAAADGRGGECHEHTAVYCRCEYSQYPWRSK
jgi:hypothetical protein